MIFLLKGCLSYVMGEYCDVYCCTPVLGCFPDGPLTCPYARQNTNPPVVAKCNLAILLSLKTATELVIQNGNLF